MFISFHTTKMNDNNILLEVDDERDLPRYASVRAPRTVTNLDGYGLSYAQMQRALLELVVSTVQRVHPSWSRQHILRHVTGTVFLL